MSSIYHVYRRGLFSMIIGVGFVSYGAVVGGRLALLLGAAGIVWGIFRFRTAAHQ